MNVFAFRSLAVLTVSALAATLAPAGAATDLYARMQHVNMNLSSYQAEVTVNVNGHSPPVPLHFTGTAYYKRPDKAAVNFNTVPFLAQQVKKVVAQLEAPVDWPALYDVTPTGDDGTTASFRLVRKKHGRIDHVDVKVDDKTATVTAMTYYYNDNDGTISYTQTYDQIDGYYVIKQQTGKVNIPHYNADVVTTFANYKLNVPVPDSVFSS